MPGRMTLREFDAYHEIREARWRVQATDAGHFKYHEVMKTLGSYPLIDRDSAHQVAQGEARKLEIMRLESLRNSPDVHAGRLAVGMRILFDAKFLDIEHAAFGLTSCDADEVPPEPVEVELPDGQVTSGLILQKAGFIIDRTFTRYPVTVISSAGEYGELYEFGRGSAVAEFALSDITAITNANGGFWAPLTRANSPIIGAMLGTN